MKEFLCKLLVIIVLFLPISCKLTEKKVYQKIDKIDIVKLNLTFSSGVKINGRTFGDASTDTSADKTAKFNITKESKDVSSDNKNKKIFDKNKIQYYKDLSVKLSSAVVKKLNRFYTDRNIKFCDTTDDFIKMSSIIGNECQTGYLDILITDYNEGEFNLIKNIPVKIFFEAVFRDDNSKMAVLKNSYTIKPEINFPTELLRLGKILDYLTLDLSNLITKSVKSLQIKQLKKKDVKKTDNTSDKEK